MVAIGPDCKAYGDKTRFQVGEIVTFNEQESETTTWGDEGEFTMLAECSVQNACTEEGADEDGVVTGLIPK